MEYWVGAIVALAVIGAGTFGLDRGRSFYPTVLIVVASYYALFAVMGGSVKSLEVEVAVGLGFSTLALVGFKKSMWLVAAGIAGHGVFDFFVHVFIPNPGMPIWWPGFCGTADLFLGGWLAVLILKRGDHAAD